MRVLVLGVGKTGKSRVNLTGGKMAESSSAAASFRYVAGTLAALNAFLCFVLVSLTEPDRAAGIWFLSIPLLAGFAFLLMLWSVRLTSFLLLIAAVAHVMTMVLTIHDASWNGVSFSESFETVGILVGPVLLSWIVALCVLKSYRLQRSTMTLALSKGS